MPKRADGHDLVSQPFEHPQQANKIAKTLWLNMAAEEENKKRERCRIG
jgi:hypothetical protein